MRRNIDKIDKICNKFEHVETARGSNLEGLRILNSMKELRAAEGIQTELKASDAIDNNISTRKCSDHTMTRKSIQPALSQYDIRISTGNNSTTPSYVIPIILTKKRGDKQGNKRRSRVRQSLQNYFDKRDRNNNRSKTPPIHDCQPKTAVLPNQIERPNLLPTSATTSTLLMNDKPMEGLRHRRDRLIKQQLFLQGIDTTTDKT